MFDDPLQAPTEESVHQPPLCEQRIEVRMIMATRGGKPPHLEDIEQHEQIEDTDEPKEHTRDARADKGSDVPQLGQLLLHGRRREHDGEREDADDARMAEREEEADAQRPSAFLQQVTHRVVDGGDMVGVESVPEPEEIRDQAEPDQRGITGRVAEEESPANDVQDGDEPVQRSEPKPFVGGERRAECAAGRRLRNRGDVTIDIHQR